MRHPENTYSFLCTSVVANRIDQILAEESFIVEVVHISEIEGMATLENRLLELESMCSVDEDTVLMLHVHCLFPMAHDVTIDELSDEWLSSKFRSLRDFINVK